MLKLELVRFCYTPSCTFGVLHSRDGWCCFTGEQVVLNTVTPPRDSAAMAEGIYQIFVVSPKTEQMSIGIHDIADAPPIARFTSGTYIGWNGCNICVGYGLDTIACKLSDSGAALAGLYERILTAPEAFINIRHLDNTQLQHFERMAREAVQ